MIAREDNQYRNRRHLDSRVGDLKTGVSNVAEEAVWKGLARSSVFLETVAYCPAAQEDHMLDRSSR
jgi:hypothetical protein